jgi:Zn-dependent alcohol dehydrogenase
MPASLPTTFKAAVLPAVGEKLSIVDVPLELPKEGEVLIKVEACGVCHTDHTILGGHFGPL